MNFPLVACPPTYYASGTLVPPFPRMGCKSKREGHLLCLSRKSSPQLVQHPPKRPAQHVGHLLHEHRSSARKGHLPWHQPCALARLHQRHQTKRSPLRSGPARLQVRGLRPLKPPPFTVLRYTSKGGGLRGRALAALAQLARAPIGGQRGRSPLGRMGPSPPTWPTWTELRASPPDLSMCSHAACMRRGTTIGEPVASASVMRWRATRSAAT